MRSKARRRRRMAGGTVWAAVAASATGAMAASTPVTWLGGAGSWNNSTKWSGGVVPNNAGSTTFDVDVDGLPGTASTVSMSRVITVNTVTVDAGDTVAVVAGGTLHASAVTANGPVSVAGGGYFATPTLTGPGPVSVTGGYLALTGPYTLPATGAISLSSSASGSFTGGFNIGPATTFAVPAGCTTSFSSLALGPGASFTNAGTTTVSPAVNNGVGTGLANNGGTFGGAGTFTLGPFTNSGGTLAFNGSASVASDSGTLNNSGGTVALSGSAAWHVTGDIAGPVTVTGGTWTTTGAAVLSLAGEYSYGAATLADVTVNGNVQMGYNSALAGTVTNNGTITVNGGYEYLPVGTTTLAGTGAMNMAGGTFTASPLPTSAATLVNRSTIGGYGSVNANVVQNAGTIVGNSATDLLSVSGTAEFDNMPGGTLRATAGGYLNVNFGRFNGSAGLIDVRPGGQVRLTGNNNGTLTPTSTGTVGTVTADGVFNVASGSLSIGTITGTGTVAASYVADLSVSNLSTGTLLVGTYSACHLVGTGPAATVAALNLSGGALDLGRSALVVRSGSTSAVTALVAAGFSGGTWSPSGGGITSAAAAADPAHLAAVGVFQNATAGGGSTPVYTTFDGRTVSAGDVLVGLTLYGDANLDGVVNAADYARIDAGFVDQSTGWQNGHFNYDGVVDGSDYTLIDNAFNRQPQVAPPAIARPASALATVPEPAGSAAVAAVGIAPLLRGRRRRR